jgi:oligopeptide transport system substrate-binding protein
MFHNKRIVVLMTLIVIVAMVLSGCSKGTASAKAINMNLGTEPPTADPGLSTDTTSVQVVELLFLGLTDFDDQTLEVIPELATEWSVSDDGLVWTFKMRKDVEWVQYDPATKKVVTKGSVTAHDVVYGVKRTIDPATASDYAYVDYIIKGAQAVNTGESTDLDSIGVRAVDDYTVEFTLEQPAGYFPGIAGMWVNRPVPQASIEEFGAQWTEAGNIWTNGSYMLETWEHENKMVMVKNPEYYDAKNVDIGTINWAMVVEESTAFAMYENGELDVVPAPLEDMDRIKADPTLSAELYIAPQLCTYYYGFNTTKPPFDDVRVRQAFSYAIDRQKLIDTVTKGEQKPAKSFAPPGIFGTPAEDPDFVGSTYDPEKAQALLAEAGYPNGEGLPEITLMFNTSEGHQKIAQFVQQSLKENLGVTVTLANQEWAVYLDTLREDSPQMWRNGWCADYPDENNWVLEVFHPLKGSNNAKWDPESETAVEFMSLVEQAAASSDPEERAALYAQAEQILVVDACIIAPIYYYTRVVLTKPYVERTYSPLGGEHIDKWKLNK